MRALPLIVAGILFSSCALWAQEAAKTPANPPVHFHDATRELGLPAATPQPNMERRYIVQTLAGGVGLFDCDNDGRLDLVVVNEPTLEEYRRGGIPMVTLYHQEKNGKFVDITKSAGLTRKGWGMGVAVADYDNDGNLDLYVTGYGGNALYHNLGNCKFEDVTEKAGVAGGGMSTGAAWGDYDRDGKVDLFVSRYAQEDVNHLIPPDKITSRYKTFVSQVPWGIEGEGDFLFHNRGNGTFEEIGKKAGVDDSDKLLGLGAEWADYDNDGWPDLFVANDTEPDYLYHNNHDGTFEERAVASGVALSGQGQAMGSMGVDFGDYDRDGKLDLVITTFADQEDLLFHNEGNLGFNDASWLSKIGQPSFKWVGWGVGFADFDNDGWPDILMSNGHIYPGVDTVPGENETRFRQPVLLFHNNGNRTFEEVGNAAGLNARLQGRRGAAFGDIHNDGNIDVVLFNVDGPPTIFLNDTRSSNHRALFHLVGTKSNRAAIGARVTVHTGGLSQTGEVRGGGGYLSQNDLRVHFGLGSNTVMDTVEIAWPSGSHETFNKLPADAIYTIVEGEGKIKGKIALPAPSFAAK